MSMPMRPKSPLARRLAMAVPALLMAAILVARLVAQPTTRAATQATLLLLNGRVITVDSAEHVTQAVAIAGDRILAVGTTAEMERLAAPGAQRIDLKGRTVTPGLLDAHAHFSGSGADRLFVVDLSYPAVKSMADVATAIREKAATLPAGSWIQGRGWDEGKLAERRLITAKDLDAASPNHPVYLTQTTGHYGVANSVALRLAGITKDTKDPPAGTIDHAPDGTPTGVLKEGAQGLVRRLIPPRTTAETEQGIRGMVQAFNAEGMTGLKDPGIPASTWALYRKVLADSALSVRVFALWQGGRTVEGAKRLIAERAATTRPYESTGDDRLIAGGVKLYIDGSGGARTAWMYQPWNKDFKDLDADNLGYPASNPDTVRMLIRMFHDAGMHVSVHSIGDHGIDWVVDSYDQAMRENPKRGLRHGIIHANLPSDHAIDVMARLQKTMDAGYPEPSASFAWWLGDTYAGNFGPARSLRLNPFRTFRAKGMIWANGSDYGVTPFPARYGIWSAVARETLLGTYGPTPFGTTESVDAMTALKAVTIWAARQMFLEKKIGSIEPGKYADLAIWDRDVTRVPTAEIKDAKCLLTLFNGRVVYRAPGGGF
ncbi:MAG: amidohydrolase [Gemmatimonadaceae bacterium]